MPPDEPRSAYAEAPCLCGRSAGRIVLRFSFRQKRRVIRCARCCLMRTYPRPADEAEALEPYAADVSSFYGKEGRRLEHHGYARLLHEILAKVPHGRRLFDLGCGPGYKLEYWLRQGYDATGCEINPHAAALARQVAPGRVLLGRFDEVVEADRRFDVIFANHVVEHLLDPVAMLRSFHPHLAAGGLLLLAVPNAASLNGYLLGPAWYGLDADQHLWHFTPHTIRQMLRLAGYRVLRLEIRSSITRNYHRHRPPTVARRLYEKLVVRFVESLGRGDQLVAVAAPADEAPAAREIARHGG